MSAIPSTNNAIPSDQWIRKISLLVTSPAGNALDLSEFRLKFRTVQSNAFEMIPSTVEITIYNLSPQTTQAIRKEFTDVVLQAGYQPPGRFGIIFQGSIKQFKYGHESTVDSYLKIYAADGDAAHLFAVVNKTLSRGWTVQDQIQASVDAMAPYGVTMGYNGANALGGVLPQNVGGKAMTGSAASYLNQAGRTAGFTWMIVNGAVQIVPLEGYLPGEAIVLNSNTGLVGWPEQTNGGIFCSCLLNPSIKCMGRIQIANALINQTSTPSALSTEGLPGAVPSLTHPAQTIYLADVTSDGLYRALVVEHEGDTRGNPWYTHLTCLALDDSAPSAAAVRDQDQAFHPLPEGGTQ